MRRKAKKQFVKKFIVGHLQKVIFFVSNLKFWNTFCLLLLLFANYSFNSGTSAEYITYPPLYSASITPAAASQPISKQSNINIKNRKFDFSGDCLTDSKNLTSVSSQSFSPLFSNSDTSLNINILDSTSTNVSSGNSATNTPNYTFAATPPIKREPISPTNKIIIAFLTFVSIIEHVIPERFLKIIAKVARK